MWARLRKNKLPLDDRSWSGLMVQLFSFVILPMAVVLLAISFISQAMHDQSMRTMVGVRDKRAVITAATALEADIRERIATVHLLALQAESSSYEAVGKSISGSQFLIDQFDGGIALINNGGELLELSAGDGSLQSLASSLEVPSQNLFSGSMTHFLSDAFKSPNSGERLLVILETAPEREYLAAGAFTIRSLNPAALDSLLVDTHSGAYFVVDRQGQVVLSAGHAPGQSDLSAHPGVEAALQGLSGTSFIDGGWNELVVAYSSLPILGWGLVSEEDWEMVSSPSLRSTQLAPLILAPFLLLMLVALGYGAQQIVGPLRKLEERAARLAWGDYKAIQEPIGGLAEIRSLHGELVHMAEKVQASQQGMYDYVGAVTAAQEDERRRLAQELHDDTIQSLIALKQRAQLMRMQMKNRLTEQEAADLNELLALSEQTIENLRRQIRALRPIYLEDLGLSTAFGMLAQEASQTAGIPVTFQLSGAERRLDESVELALYRIAQEALNNVVWHAQAKSAAVELEFEAEAVRLSITDDGTGFQAPRSPAELAAQGHFGLLGISERADLIGAQLDLQSTPGQGTRIQIRLDTAVEGKKTPD
ncbi:MAG TPA: ATP-binding protein [Anaerolineales bacterium]|nr:ATP-binding protein [Anaerolineales bacterium]